MTCFLTQLEIACKFKCCGVTKFSLKIRSFQLAKNSAMIPDVMNLINKNNYSTLAHWM